MIGFPDACKYCGSPTNETARELGTLGRLTWFRCTACGGEYPVPVVVMASLEAGEEAS
jgi:translation initiation factor 2 beta subunit (eIF-2beta)/eIF-5